MNNTSIQRVLAGLLLLAGATAALGHKLSLPVVRPEPMGR